MLPPKRGRPAGYGFRGATGEYAQAANRETLVEIEPSKWLVVVYRESGDDGFIITAFMTRRAQTLSRRQQLWP